MHEHITFRGRAAEVLSLSKKGDGTHRVLKVVEEGRPLVLKCYGRKTGRLQATLRQYGVRLIIGKSAYSVQGRSHTEREVLALWRREGFDVPGILSPDFLSDAGQPCIAMEWIPGPTLASLLRGTEISLDRKQELVARFADVMGRRHDRAIAIKEPRLIFEHPTFNHVIVSGDRLVHFDFEIAFTGTGTIERIVRHELAGFLYALPRSHREHFPKLLETLVTAYPAPSRMKQVLEELQKYGTVPLLEWLEFFLKYFRFFKRHKKPAAETALLDRLLAVHNGQR